MPALIVLILVVLIALGFLNSVFWVGAAVLAFGLMYYGRGGTRHEGFGTDPDYRDYRAYRDRRDRWDRRYRRQRQSRWSRQARRDERDHG
ncbi:hypothetical protein ACFQLX_07870 [Streptomyces polyrhachis]|uniref:Uncharacterized protein n=1 Tax=Streptomyces polyrhachis TaxID=1282885 RepID=A0ABW2GFK2_9ACTN